LAWLAAAAAQHARGLHVALGIWLQAGSAKPGTCAGIHLATIAVSFGFHPSQAGRALAALARAGLVSVERGKHKHPLVTIRGVPPAKRARAYGSSVEAATVR
jgi:hypothetical protein